MKLGIDLDNVTVDWQGHWADLYTLWFDREVDPAVLDTWDACIEGTHFESHGEFFDWFNRAGGWNDIPPIPGAYGAIDELIRAGHVVEFVTARPPEAREATDMWLLHGPFRFSATVTLQSSKWLRPCSVYIDDSPEVIRSLVERGKTVIVFDQPWNRDLGKVDVRIHESGRTKRTDVESKVHRALDWAHVLTIVKELS